MHLSASYISCMLLAMLNQVSAAPAWSSWQQGAATCQQYMIPITATSENYLYNATEFADNYDLVDFTTLVSSANASNIFYPVESLPVNQTVSVEIAATFCQPTKGPGNTVLLATHGIGSAGE